MLQSLVAYAVVVVAAVWTVWSLFVCGWLRRRAAAKANAGCGPGCSCGD
jgi:hypothetical protein